MTTSLGTNHIVVTKIYCNYTLHSMCKSRQPWRRHTFTVRIWIWCPPYILAHITKTRLYNSDPLKPHFYIVKLGFTGVYIIFLISAQNIDCGYSLEPPRRGGSNEYHNLCFEQKYEKYQNFLSENFHFLVGKFSVHLNRHVFVMSRPKDEDVL